MEEVLDKNEIHHDPEGMKVPLLEDRVAGRSTKTIEKDRRDYVSSSKPKYVAAVHDDNKYLPKTGTGITTDRLDHLIY
jgi:hypothetical protein